ncbi:MAG: trypsin-like peptidase domain-containing protein, partial [Thermoplasmata archaeon]|nr:trypsin-like peptidase domain-containing protein [Thermoplasmata archaeon]
STHDLALLEVENMTGFTPAVLGDSATVTVGQTVVAIGNALARPGAPTVTEGQISAVGRSITASDGSSGERLQNLLQISAELSPGNSGGPLFDEFGRVIGINTAAGSGGFQSASTVGFAIPINDAKGIVSQIETGNSAGTVRVGPPAFLGVRLSDRGFGRQFGGGGGSAGVGVIGVEPGSPAESAGMAAGDTIVTFDGQSVVSSASLAQVIGMHSPGDQVSVTWVDRAGARHTATLRLASGPIA